jgi:Fic family protein
MNKRFSDAVTVFHGYRLPEEAVPVGYAALIDAYNLTVPFPYMLCAISAKHRRTEDNGWKLFTPRHAPDPSLEGHLKFAIKYEGIDLAVIKQLFKVVKPSEVENLILSTPTGAYSRRIWFLYEWLMEQRLDIPDLSSGNYLAVIDPERQYAVPGIKIKRQRVIDNMPGTRLFCPLVFRTKALDRFISINLKQQAAEVTARIPADVIKRTAAFILLKDSRASFAIENESPPHKRVERWSRIISEAGKNPLDVEEFVRLQEIVIGDNRFIKTGLRMEGGFIGEHDRDTGTPIPEHISARSEDLPDLMEGLIAFLNKVKGRLDPVIAAATLSFGFVYIHPFSDGNGRIHRYLIHHVLAENSFNPAGLVFPVSAVVLDRIEEYRTVLQDYSSRLLPLIDWEPTRSHNVNVKNKTTDYYRYFNATPHAEFLYSCVQRTIEHDLPDEAEFLKRYDQFKKNIEEIIDMPSSTINLLYRFLQQNSGKLSARARGKEFQLLTDDEVTQIESMYEVVGTSRE